MNDVATEFRNVQRSSPKFLAGARPAGDDGHSVGDHPQHRSISWHNPNPTPFGYTLSLSLFIIPIIVIGGWLVPSERLAFPRRAFWWTIGLLVPVSFGLDFFFGNTFFVFPNRGATLGIGALALGGSVPVEEYVFYLTGFSTVLLIYIWLDEFWLAAYNVPDYAAEAEKIPRLVVFHPASLVAGLVLVAAAVI
jgi:hypothetical protein